MLEIIICEYKILCFGQFYAIFISSIKHRDFNGDCIGLE